MRKLPTSIIILSFVVPLWSHFAGKTIPLKEVRIQVHPDHPKKELSFKAAQAAETQEGRSPRNAKRLMASFNIHGNTPNLLVDTASLITWVHADRFDTTGPGMKPDPALNDQGITLSYGDGQMKYVGKGIAVEEMSMAQNPQIRAQNILLLRAECENDNCDIGGNTEVNGLLGFALPNKKYDGAQGYEEYKDILFKSSNSLSFLKSIDPAVFADEGKTFGLFSCNSWSGSWTMTFGDDHKNSPCRLHGDTLTGVNRYKLHVNMNPKSEKMGLGTFPQKIPFYQWLAIIEKISIKFPGEPGDFTVLRKNTRPRTKKQLQKALFDSGSHVIEMPNEIMVPEHDENQQLWNRYLTKVGEFRDSDSAIKKEQEKVVKNCDSVKALLPRLDIWFRQETPVQGRKSSALLTKMTCGKTATRYFHAVLHPEDLMEDKPDQNCPVLLHFVQTQKLNFGLPFLQKYSTVFRWKDTLLGNPEMHMTVFDSISEKIPAIIMEVINLAQRIGTYVSQPNEVDANDVLVRVDFLGKEACDAFDAHSIIFLLEQKNDQPVGFGTQIHIRDKGARGEKPDPADTQYFSNEKKTREVGFLTDDDKDTGSLSYWLHEPQKPIRVAFKIPGVTFNDVHTAKNQEIERALGKGPGSSDTKDLVYGDSYNCHHFILNILKGLVRNKNLL